MRFGLFGTGPWAHLAHAPGLAAHPDVEFAGVWGRDPAKAAALAGEYGTKAYPSIESLIDDVDAVAIALPPDVQTPIAMVAARAGKHLFLDKPIAFDAAAADELAAAASGVASVVFHTRLFMPTLAAFVAEAAAAKGWVEARVDHVGTIYAQGNPFGKSPWRRENGGLWDVGPHALALVVPILGRVTAVTAMVGDHDMSHVLVRHSSGAISTLTLSVDAAPAAVREEAVLAGEAGVVAVPTPAWEPVHAFGHALDKLLAAAAGGPPPELDVRFGAHIVHALSAAAESARSGHTVTL